MAETDDDLEGIATRLLEDEYAATRFPNPGDPPEHDEEAMRWIHRIGHSGGDDDNNKGK